MGLPTKEDRLSIGLTVPRYKPSKSVTTAGRRAGRPLILRFLVYISRNSLGASRSLVTKETQLCHVSFVKINLTDKSIPGLYTVSLKGQLQFLTLGQCQKVTRSYCISFDASMQEEHCKTYPRSLSQFSIQPKVISKNVHTLSSRCYYLTSNDLSMGHKCKVAPRSSTVT